MRLGWRLGIAGLLCTVCAFGFFGRVLAETITVTIGVGDTILTVVGKTSPDAFVTIKSDGSVIGTALAAPDGTYTRTFPAQAPGLRQLDIFAQSTGGAQTDTVTLNINVTEHAITTVDVFLPTTLIIDDLTLDHDQPLNLSGETFPLSTVTLFLDNIDVVTALSDAQGAWTISTTLGTSEFFLRTIDGLGNQSYPTTLRFFTRAPLPGLPAIPTDPAVVTPSVPTITFPSSGTVWDQPQITVTGTAQPGTQIELWDGSRPIGSVWPNANGTWSMNLSLLQQEYRLRARACLQGQCSAFSQVIILTYQPSTTTAPTPGSGLDIRLPQLSFMVFQDHQLAIRPTILNGQPPYATTTDWGDGTSTNSTATGKDFTINHTYTKPGKYTATLYAIDVHGLAGSVQFTVEVMPVVSFYWPILLFMIGLLVALIIFFRFIHLRGIRERKKSN